MHVLGISDPPDTDLSHYRLRIFGEVEEEIVLTWEDILDLEKVNLIADFHCVTRWSCPDVSWTGFQSLEIKNW